MEAQKKISRETEIYINELAEIETEQIDNLKLKNNICLLCLNNVTSNIKNSNYICTICESL